MADIELVIKVSEELYNRFGHEYSNENLISKYTNDAILDAFCNGTPLPKGHGRLIDAGALNRKDVNCANVPMNFIDTAPTIIEADKAESEE